VRCAQTHNALRRLEGGLAVGAGSDRGAGEGDNGLRGVGSSEGARPNNSLQPTR
jgi:hypothetical protein